MIEKNIIQTHRSYEALRPYERVCLERWKWMNPDWNYRFFSNDEGDLIVKEVLGEKFDAFGRFHFGARNNIRRACLIYQLGGLFADCDLYPVKPLGDYLPTDRARVLFKYDGRPLFLNGLFASSAGDPMVMEIINLAVERLTDGKRTQPPTSERDTWLGWHFDTCGVHCFNDVFLKYEKVEDGVLGGDSHPTLAGKEGHTAVDEIKCLHLGTACWHPDAKADNGTFEKDLALLDLAKKTWGI